MMTSSVHQDVGGDACSEHRGAVLGGALRLEFLMVGWNVVEEVLALAAAMVRLEMRKQAAALLQTLAADTRPSGWNGFPEVVTAHLRQPRFVGDMPHGWVGAEFVRGFWAFWLSTRKSSWW